MNGRVQIDGRGEGIKYVAARAGGAYTRGVSSDHAAEVAAALQMLAHTRAELDEAVAAAPEISGSYALASPEIRALLVRAVKARNHLDRVLSSPQRSP